jgi:hypothetical protein
MKISREAPFLNKRVLRVVRSEPIFKTDFGTTQPPRATPRGSGVSNKM